MANGATTSSDLGIALVRLAVGVVMVVHGIGKLFGVGPSAAPLGEFGGFLGSLGVPLPTLVALGVALVETVGGLFVLAGFLTRYAAALFAADMLAATLLVHLPRGFSVANGGYEFTLTLFLAALALVFLGSGSFSVDRAVLGREPVPSAVRR
ncbi:MULTISPECIES: DoxX family protein [Halorussus]|uniref:DoxX family protein n=1 Tax=Halorussus TaxID=1070314 RepID=UPI00209CE901|nr:DoxX family protein [Halorussus vallis]USZ73886.1 DoxX family protein [Halorussus vallis]